MFGMKKINSKGESPVTIAVELGAFMVVIAYFVSWAMSHYNEGYVKGNFSTDQQAVIALALVLGFLGIGLSYLGYVKLKK